MHLSVRVRQLCLCVSVHVSVCVYWHVLTPMFVFVLVYLPVCVFQ